MPKRARRNPAGRGRTTACTKAIVGRSVGWSSERASERGHILLYAGTTKENVLLSGPVQFGLLVPRKRCPRERKEGRKEGGKRVVYTYYVRRSSFPRLTRVRGRARHLL